MAKLRKMMGNVDDPVIISLMELIETQSASTLGIWAISYVETYILDIFEKSYPEEAGLRRILSASREYLDGSRTIKEIKVLIKESGQIVKDAESNPAAQAAARAVTTACSAAYLPTGALGFTFYAAAAVVYDRAGLLECQAAYDNMARDVLEQILVSLKAAAVSDEKNPVKVNWHC